MPASVLCTVAEPLAVIEAVRTSGINKSEFARRIGLSVATVRGWAGPSERGIAIEPVRVTSYVLNHEALDRLARLDPGKAELVKLRYFVGMTLAEAAAALGISEPAAKRRWSLAGFAVRYTQES